MAKRKPRIEYTWRSRQELHVSQWETIHEVTWSLYGANGEYMCGSGSEGYRDMTDARRAIGDCLYALAGHDIDWGLDPALFMFKEVGPGRKPK